MADPITIFRKTTGLNTLIDPVDLDISEGIQELAVAADVEISDKGRLSRRKGYTSVLSGSYHSLFCNGGDCICVSGTSLLQVLPDYTTVILDTVTENAKLNAVQVNNRIYWCNGYEKGYVENGANNDWVIGDYVGPTTLRSLVSPPTGTLVEYYNGRMYVVQGSALWFSEELNYGAFDFLRGIIPFATNIHMVRAVNDGIYISNAEGIYFLEGTYPGEFRLVHKSSATAIPGTDAKFFGDLLYDRDGKFFITKSNKKAAIWLSDKGICAGFSAGNFVNLTEEKLESLPNGLSGSGVVYNNKYVGLINP